VNLDRPAIIAQKLNDEAWWRDPPSWAVDVLKSMLTSVQTHLSEVNADMRGERGSTLSQLQARRASLVKRQNKMIDRLAQAQAQAKTKAQPRPVEKDFQTVFKAVGVIKDRVRQLEEGIAAHKQAIHDDEIEPGGHDRDLWALIEGETDG
jgi:hypothetical protein